MFNPIEVIKEIITLINEIDKGIRQLREQILCLRDILSKNYLKFGFMLLTIAIILFVFTAIVIYKISKKSFSYLKTKVEKIEENEGGDRNENGTQNHTLRGAGLRRGVFPGNGPGTGDRRGGGAAQTGFRRDGVRAAPGEGFLTQSAGSLDKRAHGGNLAVNLVGAGMEHSTFYFSHI